MKFFSRLAAVAIVVGAVALTGCARKRRAVHFPPTPSGPESGLASWYGYPYHGRPAADGEIYDMEKMTAAHRTLPFGTWVRVTNLTNGKTVDVRIIDRGPFIDGRIIDLSHAAARAIDLIGPGVAPVRLDIIPPPASTPALVAAAVVSPPAPAPPATTTRPTSGAPVIAPLAARYSIQVGVFEHRSNAERLLATMRPLYGDARIVARPGRPNLWIVLVGAADDLDDANALAGRVRAQTGEALVIRMDAVTPGPDDPQE